MRARGEFQALSGEGRFTSFGAMAGFTAVSANGVGSGNYLRTLILLLLLKTLIMGWNAASFVGVEQYDFWKQYPRFGNCGFKMTYMGYNPPLYFMIGCPLVPLGYFVHTENTVEEILIPYLKGEEGIRARYAERHGIADFREEVTYPVYWDFVLSGYRWINLVMLVGFYGLWLFYIFPKLLPRPPDWFAAGLLLLLLPGFQKMGVMAQGDNLFVFTATVAYALWLSWRDKPTWGVREAAWFALAIGALGSSRPMSVIPVLVLGLLAAWKIWVGMPSEGLRRWGAGKLRLFSLYSLIVILLCGPWWAFRYVEYGSVVKTNEPYMAKYRELEKRWDRVAFFTHFPFTALLKTPNRFVRRPDENGVRAPSSFYTHFYSELWGDHGLYFSGPKSVDLKPHFK